ncbi:phage terminase, small subunit, putative, P27 family [Faunimonas pinastri]|uniref:Phage terminase, small subunit, putative, P27 family n=1 Tax=Faunimonas pinastri TaxID=1855383 RepID=A0A1H9F7P8_9HYPH|nr:P27 family phage terminase small subunit [Faunimonas pinastri]SEQ33463.1 phage terminase, small subunit, putative, P27 family [Faunimonas pinastri]
MKGRKPKLDNVVPMRSDAGVDAEKLRRDTAIREARRLRPRNLTPELRREWDRVAPLLADPAIGRLKSHFVDTVVEYCRAVVRLRALRERMPELDDETYEVTGRNGSQMKSRPEVAQLNETWRHWRSLVAMLGLSPADERNMAVGQGDLFDPSDGYF